MDTEPEDTDATYNYANPSGQAITCVDLLRAADHSTRRDLLERARRAALVRREAEARGIVIEAEALQEAANAFREERDLFSGADTVAWLDEHALPSDEWMLHLEDTLLTERLRERVLTDEARLRWFAQNRLRYDAVELYRIVVQSEEAARELRLQIEEGVDFFALARRFTLEPRRPVGGYLGYVSRDVLSPRAESAVFGALPSATGSPLTDCPVGPLLVGPVPEELTGPGTRSLYLITNCIPASLAVPGVHARVDDDLFAHWLAELP